MVCLYNGILFSHEKAQNLAIYDNMAGPWGTILSEMRQRKIKYTRSLLYVESKYQVH